MQNRTMMILGATRLLVWGAMLVGPLVLAMLVLSHASTILKPIAALYQVNPPPVSHAKTSPTAGATQLPSVNLSKVLTHSNTNSLQNALSQLQEQLGQAQAPAMTPTAVNPADQANTRAIAELRQQLAESRQQIQQLNIALQNQKKLVDAIKAKDQADQNNQSVAVANLSRQAASYIAERVAYGNAVQSRDEAEKTLEQVQANPKSTGRQIYVAAYNLMVRRSLVMRLNWQHTAVPKMMNLAEKPDPQIGYTQALASLAKSRAQVDAQRQRVLADLETQPDYQARLNQKWRDNGNLVQLKENFAPESTITQAAQVLMADRVELGKMQAAALQSDRPYQLAMNVMNQSLSAMAAIRNSMPKVASARR